MTNRKYFLDIAAVILLILLWLLFFWRLFTPMAADQASLTNGDFSGQFVAFGAYQYQRLSAGEVPLWNPYNNGGLPFIADTQAAVFYPPRLVTIGLSSLAGGWSYNALQLEMTFHVLLYSLLMYLFVRRLTLKQQGSIFGAFIAAIIIAYGGYTSSYPQLQLAVLEAGVWFPLAAVGLLEATRTDRLNWRWLLLAGWALGLSWLAGHPQTSWFLTYALTAYYAYRVFTQRYRWTTFVTGTALFGIVSVGVTTVTLLPGAEYLLQTTRTDLGFDAKGNGFPFQDVAQLLFPGSVSLWSPLYIGIPGLIFALGALRRKLPGALFWGILALVALGLSFGANSAVYHLAYNIMPGARFFRGQERAAYLFVNSLAILAGMGSSYFITRLAQKDDTPFTRNIALWMLIICAFVAGGTFILWQGSSDAYGAWIGMAFFSAMIAILFYLLLRLSGKLKWQYVALLSSLLICFELFSIAIDNSNYDPIPAEQQLNMTPPSLVQAAIDDAGDSPVWRVDGFRGLRDNYGSLYGVMDIRGISPLFLNGPQRIIYRDYVNNPLAWELFAVDYVFSERDGFSIPTEIIAEGTDRDGAVTLHRLSDPRPFALLMYDYALVDSDEFADALLNDPRFTPRSTVILREKPQLSIEAGEYDTARADVTEFAPEQFTVEVTTPENAILSLAHPDYPGWKATLDGEPVDIIRAYGALTAVAIPAGEHTLSLTYDSLSYRIGAILSLVTWGALIILGVVFVSRRLTISRTGEGTNNAVSE